MEFPISRERLQNYKANEADSVGIKQGISKEMKQICKDVEIIVLTTNERKYVYRNVAYIKRMHIESKMRIGGNMALDKAFNCLNELLEAIKNTFPDCIITIDPLETYIIIDWS